jgi:hypothetical protein
LALTAGKAARRSSLLDPVGPLGPAGEKHEYEDDRDKSERVKIQVEAGEEKKDKP